MVTPTLSRVVNGPYQVPSFEPLSADVCESRTHSTAIARRESSSGKRGWPGGGATTAGGVSGRAAALPPADVADSVDPAIGADGGTRTPKGIAHRVLSAARLPVPPHPRGVSVAILGGCGAHGGCDFGGQAIDLLQRVVVAERHDEAVEAEVAVQAGELLDPVLGRSLEPAGGGSA